MAEKSREQRTFTTTMRCPLCGKFLWYAHDYLDGRRVDGIRFGPLPDPAAMSECPKCGGRWFAYEPQLRFDIVEGERTSELMSTQSMVLDNAGGTSSLKRSKTITQEWASQLEVGGERSSGLQVSAQLGTKDVASLGVLAENALKVSYRTVEENRRTYTEAFDFEVPVGVVRTVTFTLHRLWQHGVVRSTERDGSPVEIPFRVVAGVELDVKQEDAPRREPPTPS